MINSRAINVLSKKCNIPYYDYFKGDRFEESDFYDNDHLNFMGAEKFSKILDNETVSKIKCN